MSYESIVTLIDLELHRLVQARTLLAEFMEPSVRALRKTQNLPAQEEGSNAQAAAAEPRQVTVRVLPPKRSRKRGPTGPRTRKEEPATVGALGGSVPAGPVVVSAGHVKQMQSTPQTADRGPGQSPAPENLTPEMLAQRWFRPSTT